MSTDEHEQLTRTPVLPGVRAALSALNDDGGVTARDAGAASLAVRYAELMDEAVAAQKYATALRTVSNFIDWNIDNAPRDQRDKVRAAWDKISSALAEHSVASDLGPKLLAALTGLQLTPAAHAPKPAAEQAKAEVKQMENPLQLLRDDAHERWTAGGA